MSSTFLTARWIYDCDYGQGTCWQIGRVWRMAHDQSSTASVCSIAWPFDRDSGDYFFTIALRSILYCQHECWIFRWLLLSTSSINLILLSFTFFKCIRTFVYVILPDSISWRRKMHSWLLYPMFWIRTYFTLAIRLIWHVVSSLVLSIANPAMSLFGRR